MPLQWRAETLRRDRVSVAMRSDYKDSVDLKSCLQEFSRESGATLFYNNTTALIRTLSYYFVLSDGAIKVLL
jgi:hypothetical protein